MKSDEKALFEMKSDEKALFEKKSAGKALFEKKSDEKALSSDEELKSFGRRLLFPAQVVNNTSRWLLLLVNLCRTALLAGRSLNKG